MSTTREHVPADGERPPLELVRSSRRRRTASAYLRDTDGVVVVQLPAGMPSAEEHRMVAHLVSRITARARTTEDDEQLARRAQRLSERFLGGVAPEAIAWSERMVSNYGSCTPTDRTIRISRQLARYPRYVLDYVLVHELAHLTHADHSPAFWELVGRYPQTDRARGFLDGIAYLPTAG
jgi:predicted metal-dependent hydrolase